MNERKARNIAVQILAYYLGEAWHDLDCTHYSTLQEYEKEQIKFYIYFYAHRFFRQLRHPYKLH